LFFGSVLEFQLYQNDLLIFGIIDFSLIFLALILSIYHHTSMDNSFLPTHAIDFFHRFLEL
jgi:hypothetical protein